MAVLPPPRKWPNVTGLNIQAILLHISFSKILPIIVIKLIFAIVINTQGVLTLTFKQGYLNCDAKVAWNVFTWDYRIKGELTKKILFLFSLDQVSLISLLKYFPLKMSLT